MRFLGVIAAAIVTLSAFSSIAQDAPAPAAEAKKAPANPNEVGAGDLLITTSRVVLEGRKRSESIILNNRGNKEATYRITLEHKRMLESGAYENIDEKHPARPEDKFADDLVRYSPRQVTLKPAESQTVKITMRVPDGTPEGEYRSHILFAAVPDKSKGTDLDAAPKEADKVSIKLTPIYGLSIPLIVRVGDLNATVSMSDIAIKDDKLTMVLNRQGARSVYGDVAVTNDSGVVVAQLKGVAVFTPNEKRQVSIAIKPPAGVTLTGAPLSIVYREREDAGGNILAEGKTK